MGDGKNLYMKMGYKRPGKAKLMYNFLLRFLTGLRLYRRWKKGYYKPFTAPYSLFL